MRSYYKKNAGPLLRERLEELAQASPGERHSLSEEVDLARTMTERAVKLFEAACFGETQASPENQAQAIVAVKSSLAFVADIVTRAARARQIDLDTFDVEQLDYIVAQVTLVIEEEVAAHDRAMADRVVERLKSIRMPERRGAGAGTIEAAAEDLARAMRDQAAAIDDSVSIDGD